MTNELPDTQKNAMCFLVVTYLPLAALIYRNQESNSKVKSIATESLENL
jgi:hypothetical protein